MHRQSGCLQVKDHKLGGKMQRHSIIWKQYQAILSYTGTILFLSGILMLTPLLVLIGRHDEIIYAKDFIIPAVILLFIGGLLWRIFLPSRSMTLTIQEGGVVVLFCWIINSVFAGIPFMTILGLNFTQAVFESVSGWTTTGLSVVNVLEAPYMVLLWRSTTQFIGGAGLVIITTAAITGPSGTGVSFAEGKTELLTPHIRGSVKRIVYIYLGYAVLGIILYMMAGMSFFDAINHSFAAISTGGFSTKPENIGYWDSTFVESVSILLMILGNLNFLVAYFLVKGKFKVFIQNGEIKVMAVLIPLSTVIAFFFVCNDIYPTATKSLRVAFFEVVTSLTTTGFTSTVYTEWNSLGYLILIVLMIIGGGTCSTAGGIKQIRIYILFKSIFWEIARAFLPKSAVIENPIWKGEQKEFINNELIRQITAFVSLYMFLYLLGSGIISAYGYKLHESLFEFASSLSTVGISCGVTMPSTHPVVLWTETLGMFMGRLEFFIIFISIGKIMRDIVNGLKKG
jgi:trk system potassium uptake protein TrkH